MNEAAPTPTAGSRFSAWMQRNKLLSTLLVVGPVLASFMAFLNVSNYWVQHNWPRPVFISEHNRLHKDTLKLELEFRLLKKRYLQSVVADIERDLARLNTKDHSAFTALQDQKTLLTDEIEDLLRKIAELQTLVEN